MNDKEIKKWIRQKAANNPEKYYPVESLKEMGFKRYTCKFCGRHFWSSTPRDYCDDPVCREKAGVLPYGFISNPPSKKKLSYVDSWKLGWVKTFKKFNHTPIERYPVVARWRDDVYFVQASIYDFQPHVVSGEVDPPANPLLVPQFCLRFNDVDNVGLSGRHYTGFVMVGEHAFNTPEKYVYFKSEGIKYIHEFLNNIGISDEDIIFHEDGWAGGGNFGVSIEYFSRGLELGNQVYMQYEMSPSGPRELKTKVIDMGAGLERTPWILNGTPTSYDNVFPSTLDYMTKTTGFKKDKNIWSVFPQYAAILNSDEMNMEESWKEISKKIGYDVGFLKNNVYTMKKIYSIADHIRTILIAVNDGALPSNSGGGYNLRYVLRRAFSMAESLGLDLYKILDHEVKDIEGLYPDVRDMKDVVRDVISVEEERYEKTKEKSKKVILKFAKKDVSTDDLVMLYESYGVNPETIVNEAKKLGKNISIPDNFYSKLSELKKKSKKKKKKLEIDVNGIPKTEDLYHTNLTEFKAKIIKIIDDWVILDRTAFYPESGGQEHDTGYINDLEVTDVQKVRGVILHKVAGKLNEGETVTCKINVERRKQLTIHHTATHVINAAARKVLGKHIWQHGAHKSEEKAHLDITHYKTLSEEEVKKIEETANEIVAADYKVITEILSRTEAEKKYTVRIYQGGAVPGKVLRIVSIDDIDHEACGGTHVKRTSELGKIIILKSERIQDGIIRIEFVAGNAAEKFENKMKKIVDDVASALKCGREEILQRVSDLIKKYDELREKKRMEERNYVDSMSHELSQKAEKVGKYEMIVSTANHIAELGKALQKQDRIVVLSDGKNVFIISKTPIDANELMKRMCKELGGRGGGRKDTAQGVIDWNDDAEKFVKDEIRSMLWKTEK